MGGRKGLFEGMGERRSGALEEADVLRLAREAMADVAWMLRREVVRRTPLGATGNLRGSVFAETRGDGRGRVRGVVFSVADYAPYVECGRRAGGALPPWRRGSPLYAWVVRNLEPRGGSFESAAFLVARAIARRGTRGRHMFARAFDENRGRVAERFDALAEEIGRRICG